MAREVKLTITKLGAYGVRGLQDAVSRDEFVIAARWQDGDAKYFVFDPDDEAELALQAGALGIKCEPHEMHEYIEREYGSSVADKAIYYRHSGGKGTGL
jgi:hypothetical protein